MLYLEHLFVLFLFNKIQFESKVNDQPFFNFKSWGEIFQKPAPVQPKITIKMCQMTRVLCFSIQ